MAQSLPKRNQRTYSRIAECIKASACVFSLNRLFWLFHIQRRVCPINLEKTLDIFQLCKGNDESVISLMGETLGGERKSFENLQKMLFGNNYLDFRNNVYYK